VNGVCRGDHVLYECRSVFFGQLQHLGNVMIAGYDAAARMGLFLEKVNDRCRKLTDLITELCYQFSLGTVSAIHIHYNFLLLILFYRTFCNYVRSTLPILQLFSYLGTNIHELLTVNRTGFRSGGRQKLCFLFERNSPGHISVKIKASEFPAFAAVKGKERIQT
jgi:hypothetical protein